MESSGNPKSIRVRTEEGCQMSAQIIILSTHPDYRLSYLTVGLASALACDRIIWGGGKSIDVFEQSHIRVQHQLDTSNSIYVARMALLEFAIKTKDEFPHLPHVWRALWRALTIWCGTSDGAVMMLR